MYMQEYMRKDACLCVIWDVNMILIIVTDDNKRNSMKYEKLIDTINTLILH